MPEVLEASHANGWPEFEIQPPGRREVYYPILLFESRLAGSLAGAGGAAFPGCEEVDAANETKAGVVVASARAL